MMREFIAQMIKDAKDVSLTNGQAKYRAYFIKTKLYAKYRGDVDAILTIDGYGDCIVAE